MGAVLHFKIEIIYFPPGGVQAEGGHGWILFNVFYTEHKHFIDGRFFFEFLKRDFPRVPITSDTAMFRKLVKLGSELMALHLMESDKLDNHITAFPVEGDNAVIKVGETGKKLADVNNGKGKLYINKTQYFGNLPEEVWNFHIGGYQVCHKWLKDRRGRKLSTDDIEHYRKVVTALGETIRIMAEIDEVIDSHGGWPDAFATK